IARDGGRSGRAWPAAMHSAGKCRSMSLSESPRRQGLKWVAGAALVPATLLTLGYWLSRPSREQRWKAIQTAVDSQRWADVESGLRHWLRNDPEDRNAWTMLGGLLFDQGREDEALMALRRVRPVDQDWVHAQTLLGEIAIKQR